MAALSFSVFSGAPAFAQPILGENYIYADDADEGDVFGLCVAISGTTAIVGAHRDADGGYKSGSAYLFDTETWDQLFKLTAFDAAANDEFGRIVAISGTTAIVGSQRDDDGGHDSGSAYLFDTETGFFISKLTASDAAVNDHFGQSVAIWGTTAAVTSASENGSCYLFDTTTGAQLAKITSSDAGEGSRLGSRVAISGTTMIIGASSESGAGTQSGSAYLFDIKTGHLLHKLTASDAAAYDGFGASVAISGTMAIVGSRDDDGEFHNTGSAYLFDTESGLQVAKLTASDAEINDQFGNSVSISGTTAIVGAANDDSSTTWDSGSVYLFDTRSGLQIDKLTAPGAANDDQYGCSVAISGRTLIIGAYLDDSEEDDAGVAYLYDLPAPCFADLTGEGDLNFLDVSAFLAAFGDHEPAADFDADGNFNFLDVSAFLAAFAAGCP
tara:strand:- start:447 stop:1769 length:1323 start_codon:yes stop_codon:yes gene_type:complete